MSNNYQSKGHSNKDVTTAVVTEWGEGLWEVVVQEARKLLPGNNATMDTTLLTTMRLGGWGKYNNQMYERQTKLGDIKQK